MKEFVLNYAEYILVLITVCLSFLILDYRDKRDNEKEKKKFLQASLFGGIVGASIPILIWFFS